MNTVRVLVVDDSLTIRAILESLLEKSHACEVIGAASDIAAARAVMASHTPDVITLDLALPDMDGMSFLAELGTHPHPPVVVISSSVGVGSEASRRALALGAVACFDKAQLVKRGPDLVRLLRQAVRDYHRERLDEIERQDKRERALLG